MSNNRYKLHPVSTIINFVKGLKDLIIPFLIIFVANGFNVSFNPKEEGFWAELIPLVIMSIFTLAYLFNGVLKWWTFVYWFEEDELRVEYGFLIKKKRYIPFHRIQSFNYKEGIFHRIFGLVQVMVETAGSTDGKPEVILTAITKEAAKQIEQVTRNVKQNNMDSLTDVEGNVAILEDENSIIQPQRTILKMNMKDLIILASTSNSIGVVLAGVAAVLSQFSEFIPYEWIFEEVSSFIKFGFVFVTLIIFAGLLVAWLISVMITFINYYNYTVIEEDERITITRGLLEKKKITIPLNRIQAIKIVENPLKQLFGYSSVVVESASAGYGEKDKKMTLFPLISKKKVYQPLQELLPAFEWEQSLTRPPKKAKPFFYRLDFFWIVPLIGLCSYFWFPFGLLSILIIIPVIFLGLWQYKTTGFAIKGNQLTIVYRIISKVTFVVEKKRIQAIQSKQSYFQRRKNISSVQAIVMSGMTGATAKASNLNEHDAEQVLRWFEKSNA
ncbi:putative membrane protein [Ureibacillus xyleni]|uniref:Putative membrane protein n=1 Tax=Ureibacillus xyleni TaxID=614648 RepID=A0A285TEX0_9BACL|nr:PH domain-containing protein [Ureibacillus xyleni]SOC18521.1 putative membrane protein [Ureibacillus xyleni]